MANDIITPPGTSLDPSLAYGAVTPSDTLPLTYNGIPRAAKSFYVGSAGGNIALVDINGNATTFTAVPIGILRVMAVRVNSTNTTSTGIVALY